MFTPKGVTAQLPPVVMIPYPIITVMIKEDFCAYAMGMTRNMPQTNPWHRDEETQSILALDLPVMNFGLRDCDI